MFEVLTRSLPFEGISTWEIEKEVAQKKHRPTVPSYCPPGEKFRFTFLMNVEYKKLMTWCWHQDPEKRPSAEKVQYQCDFK